MLSSASSFPPNARIGTVRTRSEELVVPGLPSEWEVTSQGLHQQEAGIKGPEPGIEPRYSIVRCEQVPTAKPDAHSLPKVNVFKFPIKCVFELRVMQCAFGNGPSHTSIT